MAALSAQPWDKWKPPGSGPMQVLGGLPATMYGALHESGWVWALHEEDYDEIPAPLMVLLLERAGKSRFMLEAAPTMPEIDIRILGPNDESQLDLISELCDALGLPTELIGLVTNWPDD